MQELVKQKILVVFILPTNEDVEKFSAHINDSLRNF